MGMSASQMRYCMLTGRKNDVQFQGQQINQQRTSLATETSAYNAQLLNLSVPTPPSSNDYTKTAYTFESNGESRTITGTQYKTANYQVDNITYPAGTYLVYYSTDSITSKGKSSGSSRFSSTNANGVTTYTTSQGTILTPVVTNQNDPDYSATDISNTALIEQDCGLPNGTNFYKYTSNGVAKYVSAANLATNANTTNAISTYYVDENATVTTTSQLGGCAVDWNESGRMTSITDNDGNTFTLSVNTVNDEAAFNDAYNQYEYKKASYDKEINNINAKICIVASQDKKLELKLKDLDTQNNAIQTELDSVKEVIKKNVEQSFKAFA